MHGVVLADRFKILFISIMLIPEFMFVPSVWQTVNETTKTVIATVIVMPYIFLYLSVYTEPGTINDSTYGFHSRLYPYDHIIFDPGRKCSTCKIIKVESRCSIVRQRLTLLSQRDQNTAASAESVSPAVITTASL